MERFSYPSLAALMAESTELLELLEAESYGHKQDLIEEQEEQKEELAEQQARLAAASEQY